MGWQSAVPNPSCRGALLSLTHGNAQADYSNDHIQGSCVFAHPTNFDFFESTSRYQAV